VKYQYKKIKKRKFLLQFSILIKMSIMLTSAKEKLGEQAEIV
jgi:hypothetical protein